MKELSTRLYLWPNELDGKIQSSLAKLGYDLSKPNELARSILRLSDFYAENSSHATPWRHDWAQAAYLCYFHPLNLMRAQAVFHEAKRQQMLKGIKNILDFGSGLGAGSYFFQNEIPVVNYVENSQEAQRLHRQLLNSEQNSPWHTDLPEMNFSQSLGIFSYSFTELEKLPDWALSMKALVIIEPSTADDGRRLMEVRQNLIQQKFQILAPCTHQKNCPLLTDSKTDWCHDRIHWQQPEWFQKIEALLPIKNRTLTFSYLLAAQGVTASTLPEKSARLVGDCLEEKGKTRQLVCFDEKRRFLTWMHRHLKPEPLPRGVLIEIPSSVEKSNELRTEEIPRIL